MNNLEQIIDEIKKVLDDAGVPDYDNIVDRVKECVKNYKSNFSYEDYLRKKILGSERRS